MGSSAHRGGRYKLFAGGVTCFLKTFEERGELFLGLVEDLRPKWGGAFSQFWSVFRVLDWGS